MLARADEDNNFTKDASENMSTCAPLGEVFAGDQDGVESRGKDGHAGCTLTELRTTNQYFCLVLWLFPSTFMTTGLRHRANVKT